MKIVKKFLFIVLLLILSINLLNYKNNNKVNASEIELVNGSYVDLSSIKKSLADINLSFEFTTNINLDGNNNALLVGFASESGEALSDATLIYSSCSSGLVDKSGVNLFFDEALKVVGTREENNNLYTYKFESRDFNLTDCRDQISKLVVIATKGSTITTTITFSEVKYSVKFGDESEVLYSYNSIILGPTSGSADYIYTLGTHQKVSEWNGNDSTKFVSGSTRALNNVVYSASYGNAENHTWNHVEATQATITSEGCKEHYECACGAMKASLTSNTLSSKDDIVISKIPHTHTYSASFNWANAPYSGNKPQVIITCTDTACGETFIVDESYVTVAYKEGSRVNPTCASLGSEIYVATLSYAGFTATSEFTYNIAKTSHSLIHITAVQATCKTEGNIEYWICSSCHKKYTDSQGKSIVRDVIIPITNTHNYVNGECSICHAKEPKTSIGCGSYLTNLVTLPIIFSIVIILKKKRNNL